MHKLTKNVILILVIYVTGVFIRSITFNLWESELNYVYEIGTYAGNILMLISIAWCILNGIKLVRTLDLKREIKLLWLTLNFTPIILLLFGLINN